MSETKEKRATFTPGPWHCGAFNGEGSIFANDGRMTFKKGGTALYPICNMVDGPTCWSDDGAVDNANARLIAAAPELYEQCKLFERTITELMMQGETGGYEELEKLREILAKVETR
tara:strand:+ start:237 stop:584 length:348 start_codon:yes stop_codon:yes gene_type:complete